MCSAMRDDPYGHGKRLAFVTEALTGAAGPVLDIGCGTGAQLTRPLAEAFPALDFLAIDSDAASIALANGENPPANLVFGLPDSLNDAARFDRVIASEVLEHVDDPPAFLLWLRDRLSAGGRLILTVPNGFGPFELAGLLELAVEAGGLGRFRRNRGADSGRDSLAVSPHVNFFAWGELRALVEAAGLRVVRARNRTFLCGFLVDQVVTRLGLEGWNARIADRLPAFMVSDWMLELEVAGPPRPSPWRRGAWASWRRRVNLWRTGGRP